MVAYMQRLSPCARLGELARTVASTKVKATRDPVRSTRSLLMASIATADTAIERTVKKALRRGGHRVRSNVSTLPGKPDIVLYQHRTVIFVHGCFWHGHSCPRGRLPKTNAAFWTAKIEANNRRDRRVKRQLNRQGWRVFIVWACKISKGVNRVLQAVAEEQALRRPK
jgi:DNA mismatch endonuclease, patch repair protein